MEILLLPAYLGHLRRCNRSPRTIDARRDILTKANAELPYGLLSATTDELAAWLYRDEWSLQTKATYYGAIKSFFGWACDPYDPRLDFDPAEMLPRPTAPRGLPRPVTDAQLRRILTEAADPYKLWALLAAYEGLRCCEIAALHREHVTEQTVTVVKGKGGKPGILPTHPAVWEAVKDLPLGPLAVATDGGRASAQYVSIRTAVYLRRKLGMPGVALHRLRHWYGTTLYQQTRDLRRVQELMRHSSPTTTAVYTLISDEERRQAVQSLPTFG